MFGRKNFCKNATTSATDPAIPAGHCGVPATPPTKCDFIDDCYSCSKTKDCHFCTSKKGQFQVKNEKLLLNFCFQVDQLVASKTRSRAMPSMQPQTVI
jgi:hypothetical protein